MSNVDTWIDTYAVCHQNRTNKLLHYVCVPVIVLSLVGILWALPVPQAFVEISPALNWGTCFMLASVVYYFILSLPLALGMLPFVLLITAILSWIDKSSWPLMQVSIALVVIAWIGQFIGHKIEGKKPAFFEDIQYLMIGPLWMLAASFKKLGLKY